MVFHRQKSPPRLDSATLESREETVGRSYFDHDRGNVSQSDTISCKIYSEVSMCSANPVSRAFISTLPPRGGMKKEARKKRGRRKGEYEKLPPPC